MTNPYVMQIDKNSENNILAFSAINIPSGQFQFYKILSESNANLILINSKDNDWYQRGIPGLHENIQSCVEYLVKKHNGNGLTICIGSSMGGYGAGLYGAKSNADIVIIFGAEFKLGLPFSRSKLHMPDNVSYQYEDLSKLIKESDNKTQYHIFVGDADIIDIYNATLLSDASNVKIYNIKNSSHNVTKYIIDNILNINELINSISGDPLDFHKKISTHISYDIIKHEKFICALYNAYISLRMREFDNAHEILKSISSPFSHANSLYNLYFGMILTRLKLPAKALPYLHRSIKINASNRDAFFELGMAYNHVGKTKQSIHFYSECLKLDSSYAPAHHHLGLIYKQDNDFHLAEAHLKSSYLLEKNDRYKKELADLYQLVIKKTSEKIKNLYL